MTTIPSLDDDAKREGRGAAPPGTGAPNPGGERATTSSRPSASRSGCHTASVFGTPCTKITVTGAWLCTARAR